MSGQAIETDHIESVLKAHEMDLQAIVREPEANAFGYTLACVCGFRYDPDPEVDHLRRHVAEMLAAAPVLSPGASS